MEFVSTAPGEVLEVRIKVCFVLPSLDGGGAERAAVDILRALPSSIFDRVLYVDRFEGRYAGYLGQGVQVAVGSQRSVGRRVAELRRFLARQRPDIAVAFLSPLALGLAGRLGCADTRLVICVQNPVQAFLEDPDYFEGRPILRWCTRVAALRIWRHFDRAIASSSEVARELVEFCGMRAERVSVIPNPLSPSVAPSVVACSPRAPVHSLPTIVTAGRLSYQKNYPLLLRAFKLVLSKISARLLILGEGARRGEVTSLIEHLGLREAVSLLGFVDDPWSIFVGAELFALASHYEGFGNVILEAMACGLPVVATTTAGARDLLEHDKDGLLVRQHTPEAFADALVRVLTDEALRRRLSAGASMKARRFQSDIIAERYSRVLQDMVNPGPGSCRVADCASSLPY